jgi:hypothetical protein
MKTTSFLISKKLEEVGLSEQLGFCDYYYNKYKQLKIIGQESYSDEPENTMVDCFAYDLETILENLGGIITIDGLGMYFNDFSIKERCAIKEVIDHIENESLANTAARLLILLHEKGLINFNEER